jgi:hypothetical protein
MNSKELYLLKKKLEMEKIDNEMRAEWEPIKAQRLKENAKPIKHTKTLFFKNIKDIATYVGSINRNINPETYKTGQKKKLKGTGKRILKPEFYPKTIFEKGPDGEVKTIENTLNLISNSKDNFINADDLFNDAKNFESNLARKTIYIGDLATSIMLDEETSQNHYNKFGFIKEAFNIPNDKIKFEYNRTKEVNTYLNKKLRQKQNIYKFYNYI